MKEMSKAKIIDKKSVISVKNERDFLSKMNHPFIVNMHYAFQDNSNLYLVMDLLTGGDLRYQACKKRKFSEEQTKYFIACIILALEYIHENKIIHRDIKPENLVLDSKGNVHLTDFGIAKFQHANNAKDTSGTPGYMSPEVMCGLDHSIAVDYFAVGVIGYEFMNGIRPYPGSSRKEIKEKIMAKQAMIKTSEIDNGWSVEAVDCINRLLLRKPSRRLGYKGASEVKQHPWFKNFPWKDLYVGKLVAPFLPKKEDNYDYNYCNGSEKIGLKTKERYNQIMTKENYSHIFEDYLYYNREDKSHNKIKTNENNNSNENQTTIPKFTNPHLKYEIEHDIELEKESRRLSGNDEELSSYIKYRRLNQSNSQGLMKNNSYINNEHSSSFIKDKSLVSKYMTGRLNNSTTNNYNINVDSNNFVYYKNNKMAINKTPSNGVIHQRNFSSNSTNLNSLK